MAAMQFESFEQFWPYYVHEHRLPSNRWLHFAGTVVAFAILGYSLFFDWSLTWWTFVAGYLPAWIGHFFLEDNRPATFKYPLWSLMGDFKMFFLTLRGQMNAEVARLASGEVVQATA